MSEHISHGYGTITTTSLGHWLVGSPACQSLGSPDTPARYMNYDLIETIDHDDKEGQDYCRHEITEQWCLVQDDVKKRVNDAIIKCDCHALEDIYDEFNVISSDSATVTGTDEG